MSWDLKPCGTAAAARRHQRRGEPLDQARLAAARRRYAETRGRSGALEKFSAPRETRNGLPEFRPYVYRGTGEDQMEAAS